MSCGCAFYTYDYNYRLGTSDSPRLLHFWSLRQTTNFRSLLLWSLKNSPNWRIDHLEGTRLDISPSEEHPSQLKRITLSPEHVTSAMLYHMWCSVSRECSSRGEEDYGSGERQFARQTRKFVLIRTHFGCGPARPFWSASLHHL